MKIQSRKFFSSGFGFVLILCSFLTLFALYANLRPESFAFTAVSHGDRSLFGSLWLAASTWLCNQTRTTMDDASTAAQIGGGSDARIRLPTSSTFLSSRPFLSNALVLNVKTRQLRRNNDTHAANENPALRRRSFPYLINEPDLCTGNGSGSVKWIVVIPSIPKHSDRRKAIRRTWADPGRIGKDVRVVFLFGASPEEAQRKALAEESAVHRDIIQSDFVDNYRNLTLKSLEMLRWVSLYCPAAEFLLKCDDDVLVQLNLLRSFVVKRKSILRRAILGCVKHDAPVIRNRGSKHYVSYEQYGSTYYPPYSLGGAYLISGRIIGDLLRASRMTKMLKPEDVSITGLLPPKIGAKVLNHDKMHDRYDSTRNPCEYKRSIAVFHLGANELLRLWQTLTPPHTQCPSSIR